MIFPCRWHRTIPKFFRNRNWWERVVWFNPRMRERSVTHIWEIANAERIRTLVGSEKTEKKQTIPSKISPSGTYCSTMPLVRLSSNKSDCSTALSLVCFVINMLQRARKSIFCFPVEFYFFWEKHPAFTPFNKKLSVFLLSIVANNDFI